MAVKTKLSIYIILNLEIWIHGITKIIKSACLHKQMYELYKKIWRSHILILYANCIVMCNHYENVFLNTKDTEIPYTHGTRKSESMDKREALKQTFFWVYKQ